MLRHDLAQHFAALSDDELLARCTPGSLVPDAETLAHAELRARGLPIPTPLPDSPEPSEGRPAATVPRTLIEKNLSPQEAQVRASFLRSLGIDADEGDVNAIQAQGLIAIALGGACLRVREDQREEAISLLKAFDAGEFSLPDDFDEQSR
jgi:hypothetical protein